MSSAKSPTKKAPAKKSSSAKPPKSKPKPSSSQPQVQIPTNLPLCIIDNGGWEIKYGLLPKAASTDTNVSCSKMPNCTARPPHQLTLLAGDEIFAMKNLGQLSFQHSLERGMVVDGGTQCSVWSRLLNLCGINVIPSNLAVNKAAQKRPSLELQIPSNNVGVVLLEPPFVPSVISEGVDRILFRELGVGRVVRVLGGCMAAVRYLEEGKSGEINPASAVNVNTGDAMQLEDDAQKDTKWINDGTKCCCVVDSGYSFTHVIPTQSGAAVESAIRRLDVGGKMLTNLLKEAVTYRQWNMMDEYHIVNDAKEQLCFISDQFDEEMKHARLTRRGLRWFDREFLLPDFVNTFKGTVQLPVPLQRKRQLEEEKKQEIEREKEELETEVEVTSDETESLKESSGQDSKTVQSKKNKKKGKKSKPVDEDTEEENDQKADNNSDADSDEETEQQRLQRLKQMREQEQKRKEAESHVRQALALSVERFAIPEVLFRPSDIGMHCGGVADAIVESINACDAKLRAAMYHNVLLAGGNAKIPGFKERVEVELRRLAPVNYAVRVFLPEDPITYAWEGAKLCSRQPDFQQKFSIDRISWESMKKAGKDQKEIWGDRVNNKMNSS